MANENSVPLNIYTVLTFVALVALLVGVVYVVMRSNDLFGTWNPMDAKDLTDLSVFLPEKLHGMIA